MSLTRAEWQREIYAKRRENSLCTRCGQPLDGKWVVCTKCHEERINYCGDNRKFYEEHKICKKCGKNRVYGTDKWCFECRAQYAEYNYKFMNALPKEKRNEYRRKNAKQIKKRYYELKKQGLCVFCGKRKPETGKVGCEMCNEKRRVLNRLRREKKQNTFEYRLDNGLCYFCGEPLEDKTKTICSKCHEKRVEIGKKGAKSNKYWKNDNKIIFKN